MINSNIGIGLALALVLLAAHPAEAAQTYCEARVSERLDRLNVDPSDIRSIFYDAQRHTNRDNERVVRILAWVRLHSCRGSLVIDLSRHCTVRQVYGRGECDLGGAVKTW